MTTLQISQLVAGLALVFSLAVFAWRLRAFSRLALPADRSTPKGSVQDGVWYAFTLGMAPWSKESTRLHWVAYLRGIAFHLGIFLGLGLLVLSPWLPALPASWRFLLAVGAGLGALLGMAGWVLRFTDPNLKALSTPDDYGAVFIVSAFLAGAALWLLLPSTGVVFYLLAALLLVYAPFSKIRHCLYYACSRLFFGRFFGRRAVLPHHPQSSLPAAR